MSDEEAWEQSKENIKPIKQGRSVANLTKLLSSSEADVKSRLQQERHNYEVELRSYSGDDPLSVWVTYIQWTEQNYPKGGKDSHLATLLKQCIEKFKDEENYKTDLRYFNIWMKMCNFCTDKLTVIKYMYNNCIGSKLAPFYHAWALELENVGNTKEADNIYMLGFTNGAEPLDFLQQQHSDFQERVVHNAMKGKNMDMNEDIQEIGPKRQILGQVKVTSNKTLPSNRSGTTKAAKGLGTTAPKIPIYNNVGNGFQIFADDSVASSSVPPQTGDWKIDPINATSQRENEKNAGAWNKAKMSKGVKGTGSQSKEVGNDEKSPFDVFVDPDSSQPEMTPHKNQFPSNALSEKKVNVPYNPIIEIEKQGNANSDGAVPMYAKDKVYAGIGEFQFEELRAITFMKKNREKKERMIELNKFAQQMEQKREINYSNLVEKIEHDNSHVVEKMENRIKEIEHKVQDMEVKLAEKIGQAEEKWKNVLASERMKFQEELERLQTSSTATSLKEQIVNSAFEPVVDFVNVNVFQDDKRNVCETKPNSNINIKEGEDSAQTALDTKRKRKPLGLLFADSKEQKVEENQIRNASSKSINHLDSDNLCLNNGENDVEMSHNLHTCEKASTKDEIRPISKPKDLIGNSNLKTQRAKSEGLPEILSMMDADNTLSDLNLFSTTKKITKLDHFHINQDLFESRNLSKDPTPNASRLSLSKSMLSSGNIAAPSPTVHTKNAYKEVCGFFNNTVSAKMGQSEEISKAKNLKKFSNAYAEESFIPSIPSTKEVFSIFHDTTEQENKSNSKEVFSIFQDNTEQEKKSNSFENKKNQSYHLEIPMKRSNQGLYTQQDYGLVDNEELIRGNIRRPNVPMDSMVDYNDDITFAPPCFSTQIFHKGAATDDDDMTFAPACFSTQIFHHGAATKDNFQYTFTPEIATRSKDTNLDNGEQIGINILNPVPNSSNSIEAVTYITKLSPIDEQSESSKSSAASSTHSSGVTGVTLGNLTESSMKSIGFNPSQPNIINEFKSPSSKLFNNIPSSKDEHLDLSLELDSAKLHTIDISNYISPNDDDLTKNIMMTSILIDPNDPFDEKVIKNFLLELPTKLESYANYTKVDITMPKLVIGSEMKISGSSWEILKKIGEGAFAEVYLINVPDPEDDDFIKKVVKVQEPACPWELYITNEVISRLSKFDFISDISSSIMQVDNGYFFQNGSYLLSEYHVNGTLLDITNLFMSHKRRVPESICILVALELLHIAEQLQACKIIHGDIKPDNFLFRSLPRFSENMILNNPESLLRNTEMVKLIDWGRSIDLTKYPEDTTFMVKVTTSGFQCIEMQTDRPWTYQTDLFGIIGTIHVLLFGCYMKCFQESGVWRTTNRFRRTFKLSSEFEELFNCFLNIQSCSDLPDISFYRKQLETGFIREEMFSNYHNAAMDLEVWLFSQNED